MIAYGQHARSQLAKFGGGACFGRFKTDEMDAHNRIIGFRGFYCQCKCPLPGEVLSGFFGKPSQIWTPLQTLAQELEKDRRTEDTLADI